MTKQIMVIGGGPAGIEAARAAATAGATVTLVSDSPVGGRAGWHSLLPSKVWLTAADTAGTVSEAGELGVTTASGLADAGAIVKRIQYVMDTWNMQQAEALKTLGVEIITGVGSFVSPGEIRVTNADGETVTLRQPDAVIVAGGSVPFFPEKLRPDGKRVLAPRFASKMDKLPASVVVIGAGATGSESVYMFNRLGVDVTWIVDEFGVLPTFAAPAGAFLAEVLAGRGVNIVTGLLADHIDRDDNDMTVVLSDGSQHRAEMAFVAIGRFPDISRFGLEAAGLAIAPKKAPSVDEYGRSAVESVYLVGDAAGAPMLANRAMAQAWVAGKHAAGATVVPFRADSVVHAIYSEPQVAQVGIVEGDGLQRVRVDYSEGLKLHLAPNAEGFVTLAFDTSRRITGAVAVGMHAADVLAPVAVAVHMAATLDDIAPIFAAHPTLSELAFIAARLG
jgi:pyruvate/2-oxoglutarate dehydrogenase complex dihydrolipoamide dehydrogenase (E3) component